MKRTSRSIKKSGFTLIELLVVIAIMTIITSIAVFSNAQFNSSIVLSNLAYEIALSVRQAQDYGISVHSASAVSGAACSDESCFDYVYGVDFNTNNSGQYVLFSNPDPGLTDPDYIYQSPGSIIVNTFTIGKGYAISKIAYLSGTTWTSISSLDVSFVRPNPDAFIEYGGGLNESEVEICIQDPSKSSSRAIDIEPTGQISVVSGCN